MGAASREIAVNQFDQRRIIGQYLDVYHRLGLLPAEAGAGEPGQMPEGRSPHEHDEE